MIRTVVKGWLKAYENYEGEECLWLDVSKDGEEHDKTLTEKLDFLCDKRATVRYYTCDKEFEEDRADEYFIRSYYGDVYCDYSMHYSEYTGYLWTDEELRIGGHDLLQELYSHVGEYILIIAEVEERA